MGTGPLVDVEEGVMTERSWLAEGYRERHYWLTGKQLAVINGVVRECDPSLFDVFEVCDLLKLIEHDQRIEEEEDDERE